MGAIYQKCKHSKIISQKSLAVLIDPDDLSHEGLNEMLLMALELGVHYFLVGGSLIVSDKFRNTIVKLKAQTKIPVIIFPGDGHHICADADAILLLSLISGRNPELLIGKHVTAAPALKRSGLEILPTGYLLIDGGAPTTVSYMSNTLPIPNNKPDIAACTAMAGEMLGLKNIYMDAGSGAIKSINPEMISAVSESVNVPLWIGGGIRTPQSLYNAFESGADIVVVGNVLQSDPSMLRELSLVSRDFNSKITSNT